MFLHDTLQTRQLGAPLDGARGAVILLHGRGSSADEIARLASALPGEGIAWLAPSASGGTWYPQRFLAPVAHNEPWLSSALGVVDQLVASARAAGLPHERIGIAGFSQGACLALEYAARHPRRLGFVAALSGGLIGPAGSPRPPADLAGTPVLLGCAELDGHIPIEHVEESARWFEASRAAVTKHIFRGSAHTVFPEEIAWLRERLAAWPAEAGVERPRAPGPGS